ncbi:trypsin-like peptidase domain-containing protein [Kribbella qitaiheensis]|uniref:Trypsin-like peptidase domain-containing protein n=1 Tax=Kribbella qitaiheensis TaxID=1544730 RepID=A0A7G6WUJ7_9ACTN|nr:serine protease [Kribbella qitaiheensis]QNE17662.1 trypsin-like peptidase domain-containing protein [Kribbella qitaiheensis]
MEDGRRELPKPPRRIPSWAVVDDEVTAGSRTTIQPRTAPVQPSRQAKPPRGPGVLAIIPLVVIVLAVGLGAGWVLRSQGQSSGDLSLDTGTVLRATGPSVVRVLASTCAGTGEATGVLFDDGRVLTAASAIRQPVSIAAMTVDGRIRRATVVGTSADGVAVLQMQGSFDISTATLASEAPDAKAERAIIAYDQTGKQSIQRAGTTQEPRALPEFLDPASVGAPVLNRNGHVTGLVTGNTVASGKIIGLDEVRRYAGLEPAVTAEPTGNCLAHGPRTAVQPSLDVAASPLATEIQRLFAAYFRALNQHDFLAMRDTYSHELALTSTDADFVRAHGTSYAFRPVITEVVGTGEKNATARVTFTVLFSPKSTGAKGTTCSRLDLRYRLVREQGRLGIDSATSVASNQSCDTD